MNEFRLHQQGAVAVYRASILDRFPWLAHGFTTRTGGVSTGGYASLNLGAGSGDNVERVRENRRVLSKAVGLEPSSIRLARQVHGREIAVLDDIQSPASEPAPGVDGLATALPWLTPLVLSADCTVLLLADPNRRAVAAVHAGWKGTVAGASESAVETMTHRFGSRPSDLVAAVGPAIGPCCYEVDEPVISAVEATFTDPDDLFRPTQPGRAHFDLWEANRRQLERAGVKAANIAVAKLCTRCHPELFFSQRGEGLTTGRFGAFISMRS